MKDSETHLLRRLGPVQATALNMSNMIGVGPFITIPLLMSALGGPQAMLGWIIAVLIAIADGMIWSELGAAMPGSGGSYVYLREAYGRESFGRLMAFLFIWQFILSGPLEIASGYIGFAHYMGYIWHGITPRGTLLVAVLVGVVNVALLYRRITSIGKITVALWIGTLLTTLGVIVTGARHFSAARAFDFPPGAFDFSIGFLFGLGAAARIGVYDYLGYYDICYLGDEVKDPGRTIPRSIIVSVLCVAVIYFAVNLSVVGVVPWREFVPAATHPQSDYVISIFMEKIYGHKVAVFFTLMVLWTAFASVFALLLGYSRVPYAAALDGYFFKIFGRLHPTKNFPDVSLLVLGALAVVCSFFSLDVVIDALIATRILIQFMGQIFAVALLRRREPDSARPYKMWLYPLPSVVAFLGWAFIFGTTEWSVILMGLGTLALGAAVFLVWSWRARRWPFLAAALVLLLLPTRGFPENSDARTDLRDGWLLQSSAAVQEDGGVVSRGDFSPKGWYPAKVPTTVLAALVENKVYPDPFFGENMRNIPGTAYPIGENFSDLPMPDDSPFRSPWWYRTQFRLPAGVRGRNLWLHFDGINFRADVWLNGAHIASSRDVAGTFRDYEFNVTAAARPGGLNTLAVEVTAPLPHELAWTWVDWNPTPPDKNMGIYRDVFLSASGPVALRHLQAAVELDTSTLAAARVTVGVDAVNASDHEVAGTLKGRIEGARFAQTATLAPGETRRIFFAPDQFPQLNLPHPRLWWPASMGAQNLYQLTVEFDAAGGASDRASVSFGVRKVSAELDADKHLLFKINGRKMLIRGGGWASDLLLRYVPERIRSELRYVKDMGLNTIRLEGNLQPDDFYDQADREGIMVMAGWPCCSRWEQWKNIEDYPQGPVWSKEDYAIAAASQSDQILRLRTHPSLLAWLNGSDNPPPPDVERMYIDILKKEQWPNPYLSSAADKPTILTSTSGVKMAGPYDWVPPSYWQSGAAPGGARGFATEIGPGPAVPPLESLRRMLPPEHLWPIDDVWNYHAGGGPFKDVKIFTAALESRYGAAKDVSDYAAKAQLMSYEGQRAMFEAFGANRYESTGVIQWMLNNAWPSLIWHLYDYYLNPGGGYFGTKKACEPVHAQYSYADKSVIAVNMTDRALPNLTLTAQVYDIELAEKFSQTARLDLPADGTRRAFVVPRIEGLSTTYFLRLTLKDGSGRTLDSNFYWLSTKDDVLDWKKSTWYYTPTASSADMTLLEALPPAKLSASVKTARSGGRETARVTVSNPGPGLAFFVHLRIARDGGADVLPIEWQENYFPLFPGEKREIAASYDVNDAGGKPVAVVVEAWNSPPLVVDRAHRGQRR